MMNPIRPFKEFQGLPVLVRSDEQPYFYYLHYLQRNMELLEQTLRRHSKVLLLRIDLRFPAYWVEPWNDALYRFLDVYRRWLAEQKFDPQYAIRMEQNTAPNPHFHLALLLNGNHADINAARYYKEQAGRFWKNTLKTTSEGLVDFCNRNWMGLPIQECLCITRPLEGAGTPFHEIREYREAFKAMSYLAKYVETDRIPSFCRKVFYSQCNR